MGQVLIEAALNICRDAYRVAELRKNRGQFFGSYEQAFGLQCSGFQCNRFALAEQAFGLQCSGFQCNRFALAEQAFGLLYFIINII